jgi:histidinol-phosphatase
VSDEIDLDRALEVARAAADAGARAAMRHFRRDVAVERKPDRSPVTVADRESEAAILGIVRAAFPAHAILAEESGAHVGAADARWIIDPLDGTRGFTRGGSFWGPLVALEHEGAIVVGAMALPALGLAYFAARGRGAWRREGEEAPVRLAVSGVADWEEATLSLGEPRALLAPPWRDGVVALGTTAASTRCYGDLAGCAQLLDGRADAWIEAGVQTWDLAPLAVLVEEAGGRLTDRQGRPSVTGGCAVATNGRLHAHVLAALGAAP